MLLCNAHPPIEAKKHPRNQRRFKACWSWSKTGANHRTARSLKNKDAIGHRDDDDEGMIKTRNVDGTSRRRTTISSHLPCESLGGVFATFDAELYRIMIMEKEEDDSAFESSSICHTVATATTTSTNESTTHSAPSSTEETISSDTDGTDIIPKPNHWVSSGHRLHHKGSPLVVRRSKSLLDCCVVALDSADVQRGERSDTKEPPKKTIAEIMADAFHLPTDSDYICSNHVKVNTERIDKLIQPLVRLKVLDEIAKEHAAAMAQGGELRHMDPDDIARGINRPSNRLGENVARGGTVHEIHEFMMTKSLADKNNVLDRRFTSFGIGTFRGADGFVYLCQVFRG